MEGFSSNLNDTFTSTRGCAEPMFFPQHILPLLPLYNAQWWGYESLTAIVLVCFIWSSFYLNCYSVSINTADFSQLLFIGSPNRPALKGYAKFQAPPIAVDFLWSREGSWRPHLYFVFFWSPDNMCPSLTFWVQLTFLAKLRIWYHLKITVSNGE